MKFPTYLQIILTALGVSLIVFVGVLSWNAVAEHETIGRPPDVRDTITISGEGTTTSRPDVALVTLGVFSEGKDVQDTQQQNTDRMNALTRALSGMGIADEDIQTSNYQIFPQYNYTDGKQELRGYRVSQSVNVKIRDLGKVGDILAKAGELGSNEIYGVSFDIDDPSALQDEARNKAIKDAKEKADALASQLGVRVVQIIGFSEGGGETPPVSLYRTYAEDAAAGIGGASPEIQSGSFDVTRYVSLTFEIR